MRSILRAMQWQGAASAFVWMLLSHVAWGAGSWPHSWGGSSTDYGQSVALDASGNVYVAGTSYSFGAGGADVLILKYGPSGTLKWAKTWGGSSDEFGTGIAVGPDGYIYVTGGTSSFGAGWFDVFLLRLDTSGNLQWGETWGGGSYDFGYDIGFDQSGNIYVSAESYSNGNCAVILKFTPGGGSPIWSASWKGPATYDAFYSLAVDSNFNVVVAGTSWDYSVSPNHNSILLAKYDSSGNYLWSENWTTPRPGEDESTSLATDGAGNIYIGGHHSAKCENSNFSECNFKTMVIGVGASGDFRWAQTWGQSGFGYVGGIGFNPNGELLVSGVQNSGTAPKYFVSSYDTSGGLLSSTGWLGDQTIAPGTNPGMAVDGLGNAFIAGGAENNGGAWAPIGAPAGGLPNELVMNSFALGTPTGQVTSLTNPTVSQTGIQNTGGGGEDVLVLRYPNSLSGGTLNPIR